MAEKKVLVEKKRLTLAEIARSEKLAGVSILSLGDSSAPKGELIAALYTITKQRTEKFTFQEALEMSDIDEIVEWIDEQTGFFTIMASNVAKKSK